MRGHKRQSVGIKELKDRASEIIATVQRTGRAVTITKNNREVAQITALPTDPIERLVAAEVLLPARNARPLADFLKEHFKGPWDGDASVALQAIFDDRNED
jgi:prevent-host-death family protein